MTDYRPLVCRLTVLNPVPVSLEAGMRERFRALAVDAGRLRIDVEVVDQAEVRALLVSLWDAGQDVLAMAVHPGCLPARGGARPPASP
jgi:hypothetical protein